MKLSLNWIKQYTDVDVPVDELVQKIGAQLGEVEGVEKLGPKYEGTVIVKVISCEDHPNADRLHVCMVDDDGAAKDVARDDNGYVQVVCGATNVHAGMLAVWLPPGATVPDSYGKEPFVLEARDLRGVVSNGMLASPRELDLSDEHDGILEIDPTEWSPRKDDVKPGAKFGEVYGLDDTIIDIENKMFTHRPDLFGQLGLAREVAGIQGKQFTSPDWYIKTQNDTFRGTSSKDSKEECLELDVVNEVPELVPRLMAVAIKGVEVKPSPLWLQLELIRVGAKPINNIVDVTNYIMLLTAQPTHAYDYDKLRGHKLVARMAKPGEKLELLNHKTYELNEADIVIADGEGPIGLGGIMGGGNSEVSSETKNIVLECANFDMYAVRRSSMRHGVFTDALTRFNKGQSPLQNDHVLQLLIQSILDVSPGEVASQVLDTQKDKDRQWVHPPVPVTTEFINARLGLNLKPDDMKQLLENVEMQVDTDGDKLTVTAPFWRTDIETREDVVEEVGRLYGYDKLPLELPTRSIQPAPKNDLLQLKNRLRENLVKGGANEVLTYSFVHGDLLQKAGQDPAKAFKVSNALSPDLQYYRLSLTPSLLDKVHGNIKAGYDQFALFELGKAHVHGEPDPAEPDVPKEVNSLSLVYASSKPGKGAAYYRVRRLFESLRDHFGLCTFVNLVPLDKADLYGNPWLEQMTAPYEPGRSAVLSDGKLIWGVIGEFKQSVRRLLKLPEYCAGFEIDPLLFLQARPDQGRYVPLSRFPSVTQDITLKVAADTSYFDVWALVDNFIQADIKRGERVAKVDHLGIYQSKDDPAHKNITLRLTIASYQKTMTDAEVTTLLDAAAVAAHENLGAERV